MSESSDQQGVFKALALVGQLGLWVLFSILLCGWAGFHLGKMLEQETAGGLAGVVAGVAFSFYGIYRRVLKTLVPPRWQQPHSKNNE